MRWCALVLLCGVLGCDDDSPTTLVPPPTGAPPSPTANAPIPTVPPEMSQPSDPSGALARRMIEEGRQTFRFDTFGDEAFWGDQLKLHQAVATLSPIDAIGLGLKVDSEALPEALIELIRKGQVDFTSPATTLALLKIDAVVGVKGFFDDEGNLKSIGIQCALCHSTVDGSGGLGIGRRLDGWPNRDLDVGKIIASAPVLTPYTALLGVDDATVRTVLRSWGPGKFDAELILDGKAFQPNGNSAATLLPAAFGLAGVNLSTYTGWGTVTYWNAFVANLEMQGQGTFYDPRLNDATRFPIAARNGFANVRHAVDLITPKLANLHLYQLSLAAPRPAPGTWDIPAAERGKLVFDGPARCASCHVPPLFTEPGWNLHTGAEIGIDDFQAMRSPTERYRTTPLKALFTRKQGGFYHDGRFATLADVVEHYQTTFALGLTTQQKNDLLQYLWSL
jgi:hypothetical protein